MTRAWEDPFDSWQRLELPKGWSLKKLAREFRVIGSGTTPPTSEADWYGDGMPWVTTGELRENVITTTAKAVTEAALAAFPALRQYPAGTLLVAMYGATVGRTGILACEAVTNQACCALADSSGLRSRYVFYWFQAFREQLIQKASGGGQPNINQDVLRETMVPAASLDAQDLIVAYLDEQTARIDTLLAEKQALLGKLSEYLYSHASAVMTMGLDPSATLHKSSFPELGSIPAHWDFKRLKFLGEVRSGVAKGKDVGGKATVSLPYLRVANVQDGYVDLTAVHNIEVAESDAERYLLRKGDVLMNEGGDNDKLGRGTVWGGQIDPCIHQNHVFAVRLYDLGLAEWVARFTSTAAARSYFFLRSKQSTNLASINQSNVRELPVPMPPAAERKVILEEMRSTAARLQELSLHVEKHIDRLREYRSSLISAAVTGQFDIGAVNERPSLAA